MQDEYIKYIGVLIDSNLNWKPMISSIVKNQKQYWNAIKYNTYCNRNMFDLCFTVINFYIFTI